MTQRATALTADVKAAFGHDARTAATIATLRGRITERATGILEDLKSLHQIVEDARPLTHSVEAFEALEELDTQTFEMLDRLRDVLVRSGLVPPEA